MSFDLACAMPFIPGTLYAELRRDTGPEWDAYVGHRFVRELAAGTLPHDEFIAWLAQDYLFVVHYARACALLIHKSPGVVEMGRLASLLHGLLNHEMALHRRQLARAGIGQAELAALPETLETLAYSRYLLDRAHTGDVLDLAVTLSACLAGYAEIGLRLMADPATTPGGPYRDWIETYAGPDYVDLARAGLAELQALAVTHGATARYPLLLAQFRQSVRLETAFWDAGRHAPPPRPASRPGRD